MEEIGESCGHPLVLHLAVRGGVGAGGSQYNDARIEVAELPETVSSTDAATLPVAGLTALYALEEGGNLLGKTVLVTRASGGVGTSCSGPGASAADGW